MDTERGADRGLEFLRGIARGCVRCPLAASRTQVVFGVGPSTARLVLLGEAPGAEEDAAGRPFVGAAGRALDRVLASVGIDRAAVYVANVVLCRPPAQPPKVNREPLAAEIEACAPYLDLQLAVLRPSVIVAFGLTPTRRLLGPVASLDAVRGRVHAASGVLVVPTWHPSAWRWGIGRRAQAAQDLALAARLAGIERRSPA